MHLSLVIGHENPSMALCWSMVLGYMWTFIDSHSA